MGFDISDKGIPENIVVISSEPAEIFDIAATKTLSQWRFKPQIINGKAARIKCRTIQFDFTLGT